MRKSLLGLLLFPLLSVAQIDLHVEPESYVYVTGREVLFVKKGIHLSDGANSKEDGSHIYLRDKSTLIQQDDSAYNSGLGELSIHQTQSGDIYDYTYWCSPVTKELITNSAQENGFFKPSTSLRRGVSTVDDTEALPFVVDENLFDSNETTLAGKWIWALSAIGANSYSDWSFLGDGSFYIPAGQGYTQKGMPFGLSSDGIDKRLIDFRGRPNTGGISFSIKTGGVPQTNYDGLLTGQRQYLFGNPYPSTMDLKTMFSQINSNQAFEKAIYFWEDGVDSHYMDQYTGGYAKWIPGSINDMSDNGTYTMPTFTSFAIGNDLGAQNGSAALSGSIINYATGNYRNRRFVAPGQGFVMVTKADPNLTSPISAGLLFFNNNMRLHIGQTFSDNGTPNDPSDDYVVNLDEDASTFNRTVDTSDHILTTEAMSHNGYDYNEIINNPTIIPEIRIYTHINNEYYRESVVAFRSESDLSYSDEGTDCLIYNKLSSDAYILADNKELSIKSAAYSEDLRIPFGVVSSHENGTEINIQVGSLRDCQDDLKVFIYDTVTSTYYDIVNDSFSIKLPEGVYNDRFEITFMEVAPEILSSSEAIKDSMNIYQNNSNQTLYIKNPEMHELTSIVIYDVSGKVIYTSKDGQTQELYEISTGGLSSGAYVVSLTVSSLSFTEKIIIHNR